MYYINRRVCLVTKENQRFFFKDSGLPCICNFWLLAGGFRLDLILLVIFFVNLCNPYIILSFNRQHNFDNESYQVR